jgi:hypothetical protein
MSTLIFEINELFFGNLSHFRKVLCVDLTTDECVVIVVSQEYVVLELEFCFVVGTLSLGTAEFEDLTFVVFRSVRGNLFFEFLTRTVVLHPVRLYSCLHTTLSSLGHWQCFRFPKELLTDVLHSGIKFCNLVDESLIELKEVFVWSKFFIFV